MVEDVVDERLREVEQNLTKHMDEKFGQLNATFAQHVVDAFPSGGVHKHREHHQSLIDSAELAKRIRQDLIAWVIKGFIGLLMFLIAIGAIEWLKRELAK